MIIAVFGSSSWMLWATYQQRVQETYNTLGNFNLALSEQAAQTIRATDLTLLSVISALRQTNAMASAKTLDSVSRGRSFFMTLVEMRSGAPQIDALAVIDENGDVMVTTQGFDAPSINVGDRDFFQAFKNSAFIEPYIGAPSKTGDTGKWAFFLARRVDDVQGRFVGVVMASISLQFFEDFYRALQIEKSGSFFLMRRDGMTLVTYPRVESAIGVSVADTRPYRDLLSVPTLGQFSVASSEGGSRYVALSVRDDYPLALAVSVDSRYARTGWGWLALSIVGVALILTTAIAILVFLVARLLNRQAHQASALKEALLQAESASRAKGAFLSTMSHELRTPLNAIIGFSELLKEQLFGPIGNARYLGYIEDIHRSGSHLLSVINDVLDMSRLEAKAFPFSLEPVDLRRSIPDACSLVGPLLAKKGQNLIENLSSGDLRVVGDRRAIHQILTNLLSNAIKFTPDGGEITVSAQHPLLPEFLCFSVADNGCGIPESYLESIGTPFVQVRDAYSGSAGGAGLGLSITRAMVKEMGGSMTIQSEVGVGTTVTVTLRRATS